MRRNSKVLGRRTLEEVDVGKIIRRQDGVELFEDYWTDSDSEVAEICDVHSSQDVEQVLFQDNTDVLGGIFGDQPSPVNNCRKRTKRAAHNKSKRTRKTGANERVSEDFGNSNVTESLNNVHSLRSGVITGANSEIDDTHSEDNGRVEETNKQHNVECSEPVLVKGNVSSVQIPPLVAMPEEMTEDIPPPGNPGASDALGMVPGKKVKTSYEDMGKNLSSDKDSGCDDDLNKGSQVNGVNNIDRVEKRDGVYTTNGVIKSHISKIPKGIPAGKEPDFSKISETSNKKPQSSRRYQTRSVCTEKDQSADQVTKTVALPRTLINGRVEAENMKKKKQKELVAQEAVSSHTGNNDRNLHPKNVEAIANTALGNEGSCEEREDVPENDHDSSVQHNRHTGNSIAKNVEMECDNIGNSSNANEGYGEKSDVGLLVRSPVCDEGDTNVEKSHSTVTSETALHSCRAENLTARSSSQTDVKLINAKKNMPKHTARKSFVRHQNSTAMAISSQSTENNGKSIETAKVQNEVLPSISKEPETINNISSLRNLNETVVTQRTSKKSVVIHHVTCATHQSGSKDGNEVSSEVFHEQYAGERHTKAWTNSVTVMHTTESVTYSTVRRTTESRKRGRKGLEKTSATNIDHENSSEAIVRRSSRQRFPPLESWRNERALFRINDGTYEFVGIDKGGKDDSEWNRTLVKKKSPRLKKVKKEKPLTAITVVDPETEEEVRAKLVTPYDSLNWICPRGSSKESSSVLVTKSHQFDDYSCGLIKIKPYREKSLQYLPEHDLVLFIVEGDIRVKIHTSQVVLHSKDTFVVPQGSPYLLLNVSSKPALIHFSMLHKSYLNDLKI